MTYVEGASLHQERAGSTVFARYAFDELWSFIAGWAVLLDFLILIAVTAFVATHYVAAFWAPLGSGVPELAMALAIVAYVAFRNVRGLGGGAGIERVSALAVADVVLQLLVIVLGAVLVVDVDALTADDRARHVATLGGPAVRADGLDGRVHEPGVGVGAGRARSASAAAI